LKLYFEEYFGDDNCSFYHIIMGAIRVRGCQNYIDILPAKDAVPQGN